jgi:hypothetical protein
MDILGTSEETLLASLDLLKDRLTLPFDIVQRIRKTPLFSPLAWHHIALIWNTTHHELKIDGGLTAMIKQQWSMLDPRRHHKSSESFATFLVLEMTDDVLHMNVLIWDPHAKTCELFDPLSSDTHPKLHNVLEQYVHKIVGKGVTFHSISEQVKYKAIQHNEVELLAALKMNLTRTRTHKIMTKTIEDQIIGYCQAWCIMYAQERILYQKSSFHITQIMLSSSADMIGKYGTHLLNHNHELVKAFKALEPKYAQQESIDPLKMIHLTIISTILNTPRSLIDI